MAQTPPRLTPAMAEQIADLRREAASRLPDEEHVWSCPGCWSWQLHCTDAVARQWGPAEFADIVEEIIREHVGRDCVSPQLVHILWKNRNRR